MLFKKNEENKKLQNKIELLTETLEKSNLRELIYILGNKKEIIIRNTIAGIFRGVGIGIRSKFNYSNISIYVTKNSIIKYTYNR